jgi:hypothetical protein
MKGTERVREVFRIMPNVEYWSEKAKEGWKLVAAEWEREIEPASKEAQWVEEVPYGLKVDEDCRHLIENQEEKEALTLMLEMIIADKPLSEVAEWVNNRGFRTRSGAKWTQIDIFELLPRLVETASRIYPTKEWSERRERIFRHIR